VKRYGINLGALAVVCAVYAGPMAAEQATEAPPAGQLNELAAYWEGMATTQPDAEGVRSFAQRLALVDEVQSQLNLGFEHQRTVVLNDLLDQTLGGSAPAVTAMAPADSGVSAEQLLRTYEARFAQGLTDEGIDDDALVRLGAFYGLYIQQAGSRIAERGGSVAAANPSDASRAVAYSLVFPFLHVPDADWSDADVRGLAEWLQQPATLLQLEDTSLRLGRPRTAWAFAKVAAEAQAGETRKEHVASDVMMYLQDTADRMLRADRFKEAINCLAGKLDECLRRDLRSEEVATRFRLAEVTADTGQPGDAAEILEPLLAEHSTAEAFGRAAMLRLKYLYEAESYEALFASSDLYLPDDRIGGYRPQGLYITWVAARRNDRPHLAESMKKEFQSKFAAHPLAADMYFAEAMEALARSDYDEAERLLEYIAYRYPESRLIQRVAEIQKRLTEAKNTAD